MTCSAECPKRSRPSRWPPPTPARRTPGCLRRRARPSRPCGLRSGRRRPPGACGPRRAWPGLASTPPRGRRRATAALPDMKKPAVTRVCGLCWMPWDADCGWASLELRPQPADAQAFFYACVSAVTAKATAAAVVLLWGPYGRGGRGGGPGTSRSPTREGRQDRVGWSRRPCGGDAPLRVKGVAPRASPGRPSALSRRSSTAGRAHRSLSSRPR